MSWIFTKSIFEILIFSYFDNFNYRSLKQKLAMDYFMWHTMYPIQAYITKSPRKMITLLKLPQLIGVPTPANLMKWHRTQLVYMIWKNIQPIILITSYTFKVINFSIYVGLRIKTVRVVTPPCHARGQPRKGDETKWTVFLAHVSPTYESLIILSCFYSQ